LPRVLLRNSIHFFQCPLQIIQLDAELEASRRLAAQAERVDIWARTRGLALRVAPVASSPTVLTSASDKLRARICGAELVDMESAGLAAVAQARRVPFVGVRVVLDNADETLPRDLDLVDAETGEMRAAHTLVALALRPRAWGDLPRLARQSRVAALGLRAFLAELFNSNAGAIVASAADVGQTASL